jgi:hypothetical protein
VSQPIPRWPTPWLQVLINNGDGSFRDETATRMPGQHGSNRHWIAFPQLIDLNARDVLAVTESGGSEGYEFYRRLS